MRVLHAKAAWVGKVHRRIAKNVVVEDVREDHRELKRYALVDLDALFHAHVDVPVGCANDGTDATAADNSSDNQGTDNSDDSGDDEDDSGECSMYFHAEGIEWE